MASGTRTRVSCQRIFDQHTTTGRGVITPDDNPLGRIFFHGLNIHDRPLVDDDVAALALGWLAHGAVVFGSASMITLLIEHKR